MARAKGHHIFEIGELVIPHPIVYLVYKDIEEDDFGIVVKKIPPTHPLNDWRKVKIFWQKASKYETYYAHHVFHLHHQEKHDELKEIWKREVEKVLNSTSSLRMGIAANLRNFLSDKYPYSNPCKGIE